MFKTVIALACITATNLLTPSNGHGYLAKPLTRGSLWRDPRFDSYNPPEDSNDRGLNCGNFANQHWINGGLCGPCGDDWREAVPRRHENNGIFGGGLIVESYNSGQVIPIELYIEAEHGGYSQFKICSLAAPSTVETNECFRDYLQFADGSGTKYPTHRTGMHNLQLQLPAGVRCNRCVIQWDYHTGQDYGDCGNGTHAIGCGPQETFRNCADVKIV